MPDPLDLIGVPAQSSKVASYAVVGIVASHHRDQMGMLVGDGLVSIVPAAEEGERGTIRLRQKLTTEPRWQIRPSFGTQSEE